MPSAIELNFAWAPSQANHPTSYEYLYKRSLSNQRAKQRHAGAQVGTQACRLLVRAENSRHQIGMSGSLRAFAGPRQSRAQPTILDCQSGLLPYIPKGISMLPSRFQPHPPPHQRQGLRVTNWVSESLPNSRDSDIQRASSSHVVHRFCQTSASPVSCPSDSIAPVLDALGVSESSVFAGLLAAALGFLFCIAGSFRGLFFCMASGFAPLTPLL